MQSPKLSTGGKLQIFFLFRSEVSNVPLDPWGWSMGSSIAPLVNNPRSCWSHFFVLCIAGIESYCHKMRTSHVMSLNCIHEDCHVIRCLCPSTCLCIEYLTCVNYPLSLGHSSQSTPNMFNNILSLWFVSFPYSEEGLCNCTARFFLTGHRSLGDVFPPENLTDRSLRNLYLRLLGQ